MAYYNIEKRLKSDGTPRYRCTVLIKEKGVITFRESKTFPKQAHAKTWGSQRVMELDLYGLPSSDDATGITVRDLLQNTSMIQTLVAKRDEQKAMFLICSLTATLQLSPAVFNRK